MNRLFIDTLFIVVQVAIEIFEALFKEYWHEEGEVLTLKLRIVLLKASIVTAALISGSVKRRINKKKKETSGFIYETSRY